MQNVFWIFKRNFFEHCARNTVQGTSIVEPSLVAAMLAVGLLPKGAVGNGSKPRAATAHGSPAVCVFRCQLQRHGEASMSRAYVVNTCCRRCYSCNHRHQHSKSKKHLLHHLMHWFVTCATSKREIISLSFHFFRVGLFSFLSVENRKKAYLWAWK